jgi:hypothetical protein
MSWLEELSLELCARGVPRRERTRIVIELDATSRASPAARTGSAIRGRWR